MVGRKVIRSDSKNINFFKRYKELEIVENYQSLRPVATWYIKEEEEMSLVNSALFIYFVSYANGMLISNISVFLLYTITFRTRKDS